MNADLCDQVSCSPSALATVIQTFGERWLRSLCASVVALALLAGGGRAAGAVPPPPTPPAANYNDGPGGCIGMALQGAITANQVNKLSMFYGKGSADWIFTGNLTENAPQVGPPPGNNAQVILDGTIQHISFPHGAVDGNAAGAAVPVKLMVEAGKLGAVAGPKPVMLAGVFPPGGGQAHGQHFDGSQWTMTVKIAPGNVNIDAYSMTFICSHFVPQKQGGGVDPRIGMASPSGPSATSAFGSASTSLDMAAGTLSVVVAVNGVSASNVAQAHLRQGKPNSPGAIIVDLQPASFVDASPVVGASQVLLNVPFPSIYVNDYLTNNTYIEITDAASNTITDQVVVADLNPGAAPLPLWSYVLLAVCLLAMIHLYTLRRRTSFGGLRH